jgi:NitT/TauT family transport system substrate-binding protein
MPSSLRIVCLVAALAVLVSCAPSSPSLPPTTAPAATPAPAATAPTGPANKVAMGYSNIAGDEIAAYAALDKGIFARHNLNVDGQLIAGGANTTAALLSGQIQIAHAGGSETISAVANGADLVVVATLAGYYPYLFEVSQDIKTLQDVVGKKLGVSNIGGSADIATRVYLRQQGLDPDKDVTIVATGSAQNRTAALLSGAIQAGMAAPPDSLAVEAIGLHPLVDLASLHLPSANTSVVMQRAFVQANHDLVQRYVDALVEASLALKQDKPGTIAILKKYFQSDDDHAMEVAYDFYANEVVQALPYPKPEQFKDSIEQLSLSNAKVREIDVSKLLDPSFVQNAADRGLDKAK